MLGLGLDSAHFVSGAAHDAASRLDLSEDQLGGLVLFRPAAFRHSVQVSDWEAVGLRSAGEIDDGISLVRRCLIRDDLDLHVVDLREIKLIVGRPECLMLAASSHRAKRAVQFQRAFFGKVKKRFTVVDGSVEFDVVGGFVFFGGKSVSYGDASGEGPYLQTSDVADAVGLSGN